MGKPNIYLVRHGETTWNVEARCQGHRDAPLSHDGVRQAVQLGQHLRHIAFDAIYASDLSRARQTAEKVAAYRQMNVQTSPALRERCFGEWEGLLHDEIGERYPDHDAARRQGGRYGIETFTQFRNRVVDQLTALAHRHTGETIFVVSHGGSINIFLHWLTAGRLGTGVTKIDNTSVTRLTFTGEGGWHLIDVNQVAHL